MLIVGEAMHVWGRGTGGYPDLSFISCEPKTSKKKATGKKNSILPLPKQSTKMILDGSGHLLKSWTEDFMACHQERYGQPSSTWGRRSWLVGTPGIVNTHGGLCKERTWTSRGNEL